jgi:serine/threonine-protein kinase
VEREIGSGAMGTVYAARELDGDRPVALKIIRRGQTADPTTLARFQREGRIIAGVSHPNIVRVFDVGQLDGEWFISMELLEGTNLADALAARESFPLADTVPVVGAVLDALEIAHGHGIVHRDIKPQNIFLGAASGDPPSVKVLDFGVARVEGLSAQEQLTRSGTILGTPEFMAPEQATGTKADARADLYSAACVAYAMLCGRPPFLESSPMRILMKQAFEPLPLPSRVRPELTHAAAIDRFLSRAMDKSPDGRYQTAAEMRAGLAELAGSPA